ncbi:MAG: hypothetical protein AAF988_02065, partial [Pseudomonadota bacterium]
MAQAEEKILNNDESPNSEDKSSASPIEIIPFGKNIEINSSARLPHLDKGPIKAYKAKGSQKISTNLFALLCARELTPRTSINNKYQSIVNPNLSPLVSSGSVRWNDGKIYYCFVYEDTLGQPLISRDEKSVALGWKPDLVMGSIIKPMINLLLDMRDKDLVHGEIWPANMYDGGSASKEKMKLGECLAAPASSLLPSFYEPIERAMADPIGRGFGSTEDDLYAFGVSLAVLMRNSDPMEGMSEDDIIQHKIEKGTYATLIGSERFSGAVLELLRGLLYDDKSQRWGLDEIQAWLDGRRLSPKQSPKRIKANRPLVYDDKKYVRPELLARDLRNNPVETAKIVENSELKVWLDRAIEDKSLKSRMENTIDDLAVIEKGDGYAERLSARIAITLNPEMPVQYKELSFMPDGFGRHLSNSYILQKDIQPHIDIIRGLFLMQIIRQKTDLDQGVMISRFDSCRNYIAQTKIGSGIERCLYVLDPECPCLSNTLSDFYVRSPEELIHALNQVARKKDKPKRIIDRHIAAFLSVKDRKNIDPYLVDLGNEDDIQQQILAEIKILATIQKRSQLLNFPDLALWVAKRLTPVYERFYDRDKRKTLETEIEKLAKIGDLTKIAFLFDDEHLYQNDYYMFGQS